MVVSLASLYKTTVSPFIHTSGMERYAAEQPLLIG